MKFHEFLEKVPNFWDTVTGYPVTVQSQINDWFYYRFCCTDDTTKFTRYLKRKLDILQPQFNNLWEKEAMLNFEPGQLEKVEQTINLTKTEGVVEAIKKILENTIKDTGTTKNETAITGTDTNKEERNLTNTDKATGTESRAITDTQTNDTNEEITRSGTEKTDRNGTRTDDLTATTTGGGTETGTVKTDGSNTGNTNKRYSDYPQSSPNSGFENYLTNQSQDSIDEQRTSTETRDLATTSNDTRKNTGSVTSVEADTLTLDTTQNNKNTGTITKNGTDVLTLDTTKTNMQSGSVTGTLTRNTNNNSTLTLDTTQETDETENINRTNDLNAKADTVINTLRTGHLEEAFEKYFAMVTTFNAVSWLIGQLDEVFIQVYDYDEFCDSGTGTSSPDIDELKRQINALQVEVTATMDYAESIHDDLQNTISSVTKNTENIATVTQVASENSAELATQNEEVNNLKNGLTFTRQPFTFEDIDVSYLNNNDEMVNEKASFTIFADYTLIDNNINSLNLMIPSAIVKSPTEEGASGRIATLGDVTIELPYTIKPFSVDINGTVNMILLYSYDTPASYSMNNSTSVKLAIEKTGTNRLSIKFITLETLYYPAIVSDFRNEIITLY